MDDPFVAKMTDEEFAAKLAQLTGEWRPIHWVGDAPTSLHGNGATSFDRTTRDPAEVTCTLCRTLLARPEPHDSGPHDA